MFQFPQNGNAETDLLQRDSDFGVADIHFGERDSFSQKRKRDTNGKDIGRNSGKRINIDIDVFDKI